MSAELAREATEYLKTELEQDATARAALASQQAVQAAQKAADVAKSLPRIGRLYVVGAVIAACGVAGLMIPSVLKAFGVQSNAGDLVACSVVLLLSGLIFVMPSLVTDGSGEYSTIRVAVLAVVLVFALLTVRAGWAAASLGDLKLDNSWVGILAMAFGGKVFQSFAEMRSASGGKGETTAKGGLVRQGHR
jgi:hypothetical protein